MALYTSLNTSFPINWNHGLNRGLLSWWLNIPNWQGGTIWRDLTKRNDGTLTAMDPNTDWVGPVGRPSGWGALNFDGTDDKVNVSSLQNDLHGLSGVTVSTWVRVTAFGHAGTAFIRMIIGDDVGAGNGTVSFRVGLDGTDGNKAKLFSSVNTTLRDSVSGSTDLSLDTWYHAVIRWEQSGRHQIYLNGVLEADTAADTNPISSTSTGILYLGDENTRARPWSGYMDDVRVYNRALTAAEVYNLYVLSQNGYLGLTNQQETGRQSLLITTSGAGGGGGGMTVKHPAPTLLGA